MKPLLFIIGLAIALALGYVFEPQLRPSLVGNPPVPKALAVEEPKLVSPLPALPKIDLTKVPAEKLPRKITISEAVEMKDSESQLSLSVAAGSKVNLVRIEGENAIVSPGAGNLEGTILASKTDVAEQLFEILIANSANPAPTAEAPSEPSPAPPILVAPAPEPSPAPPVVEDETPPAIDAAPEPAPPTEEITTPAANAPTDNATVELMKASLQAKKIKEFTYDQVIEWKAIEAPEIIEGESYQTGTVTYNADTVFGTKQIQAKALIKNGQVIRWFYPRSGMEIK